MERGASPDYDEFFDFARLEADYDAEVYEKSQDYGLIDTTVLSPECDQVMDWEPAASQAPTFVNPPPQGTVLGDPVCGGPRFDQVPPGYVPEISRPLQPLPATPIQRRPASAKHKGGSTRLSLETKQMLEEEFASNPYPCSWEIDIIAHQVNLDAKRVRIWFNNARARKKPEGTIQKTPRRSASIRSVVSRLSADSLEALSKEVDERDPATQPPLEAYLASSCRDEAADLTDIQAAVDMAPFSERSSIVVGSSSGSRIARSSSVITSVTSSESSAPTSYTMSSGGSNTSSFGRERRRGRRRMSWRDSPYTRPKADRINDAGQPSRNLPFFCTFCPRAFRTKYEWTRHEDSVHALRTTWICCSTKQGPLDVCPFCGKRSPDEVHLAGHKYQQCQNKPEAHRTFYRRDHFIQHLHHVHFANEKHPTPHLGCGTRKNARQTQLEWGCQTLALKWRKFGAPMGRDDPMLHCGFCGKTSRDWATRCDHVAEHLSAGGWDRSGWWSERKETHMDNLCEPRAAGPFRCRYCQKVFANVGGMKGHSTCQVWSCRLLRTFDDVASANSGPPLCPQFPSPKAHHCHLCGAGYKSSHIEHAHQYHKYRQCSQELYTSKEDFLLHLHEFHGASHPLLLMHNGVLEQHFSRTKGASFEPVDFDEILQGCRVATPTESFVDPFTAYQRPCSATSCDGPIDWTDALVAPPRSTNLPRSKQHSHDSNNDLAEVSSISTTQTTQTQARHKKNSRKSEPMGPRIFRLDPLVPFLSSRIYYLKRARMTELFCDGKALLREVEKGHVASLVMSSGLLGMAAARVEVGVKRDDERGVVEFAMDD